MTFNNTVMGVSFTFFIKILIFVLKCYCKLNVQLYLNPLTRKCDISSFPTNNGILHKKSVTKSSARVFTNAFLKTLSTSKKRIFFSASYWHQTSKQLSNVK